MSKTCVRALSRLIVVIRNSLICLVFFIFRDGDDESSDVDSDENNSVGKRKKLQKCGFAKKPKKSETSEEQALKVFFYFFMHR